jgi:hypothetical protein
MKDQQLANQPQAIDEKGYPAAPARDRLSLRSSIIIRLLCPAAMINLGLERRVSDVGQASACLS